MSAERIGIAGGGAIASGLACVAAERGQVVLWARRPDAATAKVERLIERRGGLGAGNVSVSDDLDGLGDATFIVEAIAEEPDAKAALLARLGGAATNGTILATTTSALSIARARPRRPAGRTASSACTSSTPSRRWTSSSSSSRARPTRRRASAPARSAPRSARRRVEVPDTPASSSTACCSRSSSTPSRCSRRPGSSRAAIDDCMRLGAGHPMGPLALLDYVGLDVAVAIGRSIGAEVPARIDAMVARRRARQEGRAGLLRLLIGAGSLSPGQKCLAEIEVRLGSSRCDERTPHRNPSSRNTTAAGLAPLSPAAVCVSLGRSSPGSPSLLLNRRERSRRLAGKVARPRHLCNPHVR